MSGNKGAKTHKINIAFGQSSIRMGDEEMDMLYRMSQHQGRSSIASVARQSVRVLYEQMASEMSEKTKSLKYRK